MDRRDLLPRQPALELSDGDLRLIACAAAGTEWRPLLPDGAPFDPDPEHADDWPEACVLHAEVIRCLLTGACWGSEKAPWPVHQRGVLIHNARIDTKLDLEGCDMIAQLWMHDSRIDGTVLLRDAKIPNIGFQGCLIRSNGRTDRRDLSRQSGCAVNAQRARIEGGLYFRKSPRHPFRAEGKVDLRGARIGGCLDCSGGRFFNPGGVALDCGALRVSGDVLLGTRPDRQVHAQQDDMPFEAFGRTEFLRAQIDGDLCCYDCVFTATEGAATRAALRLEEAHIGAGLHLERINRFDGDLDLRGAIVHSFHDDASLWSGKKPPIETADDAADSIRLDGFIYEIIADSMGEGVSYLDWLKMQPRTHLGAAFKRQPWAQLIKTLRELGHDDDAHRLVFERERLMALRPQVGRLERLWLRFLGVTVGYGYDPIRALYWSLAFLVIGTVTFHFANQAGYMAPRSDALIAYPEGNTGQNFVNVSVQYNSFIYALDAYMPVVELDQDSAWATAYPPPTVNRAKPFVDKVNEQCLPGAAANVGGCISALGAASVRAFDNKGAILFEFGLHRLVYWLEQTMGWIFGSLLIAAVSGLMKED